MPKTKPNLIVVVSDTLRADDVGCYGSRITRTPAIDAFAAQATVFDAAYPESLPTIPVRRALHTGRRAFPFRHYRPLAWDIVYLPGWQPMDEAEDVVAESLVDLGYHTGFVTDTMPYYAPGMNFTRGFRQWEQIRGQQQDRWRSPHSVTPEQMRRYGDTKVFLDDDTIFYVAANLAAAGDREEETSTARTFRWAMRFVEDNRHAQPFYLLVDAFAPHEPWDPPRSYFAMYADPDAGPVVPFLPYAKQRGGYAPELVERAVAGYRGLVSLVDTWFGRFMETLERTGVLEDSVVVLISDHGTNFRHNPDDVTGKPSFALFPGVMRIPFIIRTPGKAGRGKRVADFVYNHDVTATLYDYAGGASAQGVDGRSLRGLLGGRTQWQPREYMTCRYADDLWYRDADWWLIYDIAGQVQYAFDLRVDPECQVNRAAECPQTVCARGWRRLLKEAGGDIPRCDWLARGTDAIGRVKAADQARTRHRRKPQIL